MDADTPRLRKAVKIFGFQGGFVERERVAIIVRVNVG
jgi:hypothetical protein